ncbi:hypothetical protein [Streptomyces sp. NBC_01373]|uniref:hypothetical protein n=1 Tax=Streptomyces sp. NBC_01373 TaxID=2903843 RepID=UPI0022503E01|nr:hypothetical protein [Streptomyces sp. NBC_01373]MCX4697045.1 hypothetical protein [Streptomyces sp. NBC_01373]MCX4707030.1 hypothetical protein [Streptomyces sp. NBC_01373]
MTHIAPTFEAGQLEAAAPAVSRRVMDDYEAWVEEVTPYYVAAADNREPFTIDEIARKHQLPDPPHPKSQWGNLPGRLLNDGIIRHHSGGTSARAGYSMVHVWIGVPPAMREMVAARRREERKARRQALADQRRAA